MSIAQRRERERKARREAIMAAGERRLADRGYRLLRMEDVASEAEVSKGTLYLYFDSKDALCAAIAERRMAGKLPSLKLALETAASGLDAVGTFLMFMLKGFDENPHTFRFLADWLQAPRLNDQSKSFEAYRERVGIILGLAMACIERGQEDGSIRADIDPLHQAVQLWGSLLGLQLLRHNMDSLRKRIPHEGFDPDKLVITHVETMLTALRQQP